MTQSRISTAELAKQLNMRADSIHTHRRRRQDGSYCGIKPIKTLNGRLLWPADTAERVLGIEADHQGQAAA